MNIVIAGGGVGGLATAHALRSCGVAGRIRIVEPRMLAARSPSRVQAVWSNALRVLDALGVPRDEIEQGGQYMEGAGYRSADGRWLVRPRGRNIS